MKTLSYEELSDIRKKFDQKQVLINVQSFADYEQKHIPDSDNIPVDEENFAELVEKRLINKESSVILYCGGPQCPASTKAAEKLEAEGFTNVSVYKGGVKEWFEREGARSAA